MKHLFCVIPLAVLLVSCSAEAKPNKTETAVIYGNAYGLWSPTHPHLTGGKDKPNSPVLYTPPEPEPLVTETEIVDEVATISDVCPTLQSAPHLCQSL